MTNLIALERIEDTIIKLNKFDFFSNNYVESVAFKKLLKDATNAGISERWVLKVALKVSNKLKD
jgi:hypothetical protein